MRSEPLGSVSLTNKCFAKCIFIVFPLITHDDGLTDRETPFTLVVGVRTEQYNSVSLG